MGGMLPAAAARLSVGSRCEKLRNVAYQSAMWTIPLLTVPRTAGGRNPPLTKAATLMPPSNSEYFPPRLGQLLAAFSARSTGPPLLHSSRLVSRLSIPFQQAAGNGEARTRCS